MQKKLWSSSATCPSKNYKLPIQPAIQSLQMCNKTLTSHISDNPNIKTKPEFFIKQTRSQMRSLGSWVVAWRVKKEGQQDAWMRAIKLRIRALNPKPKTNFSQKHHHRSRADRSLQTRRNFEETVSRKEGQDAWALNKTTKDWIFLLLLLLLLLQTECSKDSSKLPIRALNPKNKLYSQNHHRSHEDGSIQTRTNFVELLMLLLHVTKN